MSLQKLLYYVQAWHLAITDEPLFEEEIQAWRDGPVVYDVWSTRKSQATRRAAAQNVDEVDLDDLASDLIDLVLSVYGSMSGEELSVLTHVERPWQEARGDLPPEAGCSNVISPDSMARFYRAHRRLGGRTATDLATVGVHLHQPTSSGPVDIDAILRSLDDDSADVGDERWGGANLDPGEHATRVDA
ncbi:type II toxin-antitoxin system antitoxin SocA domain-containing protein [Actinoplanes sp. NPDC051851]|uniref:Panacea domain-containing protein n=1 Tax=Actinoplanes sp. NPDC051851 TaxID=3154753 RepID=UPI0034410B5A